MNEQEFEQLLEHTNQPNSQAPEYLASRILASLPTREPIDQVFFWLGASLWRGALTALLPLAIGFGLSFGFDLKAVQEQDPWFETEALMYADALEEYDLDEI
jgi:hypothetical protein